MSTDLIRVAIVDDMITTRDTVRTLLQFQASIKVVAEGGTGLQAIEIAKKDQPDIFLMDINMPDMDGINASIQIRSLAPKCQIIMMSVQDDAEYLRRAMMAGARDFLMKPFTLDELLEAINTVHARALESPLYQMAQTAAPATHGKGGKAVIAPTTAVKQANTIAVFSPKGGTGCTTIATNLAISLAQSNQTVVLIDGNFQFGDVALMLNIKKGSSILDFVDQTNDLDADLISSVLIAHESGLKILLPPPRPEMSELVTAVALSAILNKMATLFDYIIIDTPSTLNENTLTILDFATQVILVVEQSLASVKGASNFIDLTQDLEYPLDKVWLVANRSATQWSVSIDSIAKALKRPIKHIIPLDEINVRKAADQGSSLMLGSKEKLPVSVAIRNLGHLITQTDAEEMAAQIAEADPKSKSNKKAPAPSSFLDRLRQMFIRK